ncbi:hypothetical protein LTR84_005797 [Exophiala bonariae]|uniref:3-oxoacyl-[acyl-carrier protein] reductase n=1 Tax=Exophiala bonariae TaxID=1690606 RepID=A0AAV9N3K1_9EURO|nr:hypothetical protein LTR84_005797 [Exophiala bonariae]
MSGTLQGKVAIVSGSSAGIGAAVAKELAQRGATVVLNYPHAGEKENATKILSSFPEPSRSIAVEADISTYQGAKTLVHAAADAFRKVDILVNNAGIMLPGDLDDPDDAKVESNWERMINLNGRGAYFLTRAVLHVLSRENSRIVNIGSGVSRVPSTGQSMYAGVKGMLETLTRSWAKELPRKYGCTVNAVAPGIVATEGYLSSPQFVRDMVKPFVDSTPVAPRETTPEEVAWTVAMLCEEKAGWLNGVYVPIAGGSIMI